MFKKLFAALLLFAVPTVAQSACPEIPFSPTLYSSIPDAEGHPPGPMCPGITFEEIQGCAYGWRDDVDAARDSANVYYLSAIVQYQVELLAAIDAWIACHATATTSAEKTACDAAYEAAKCEANSRVSFGVFIVQAVYDAAVAEATADFWACIAANCGGGGDGPGGGGPPVGSFNGEGSSVLLSLSLQGRLDDAAFKAKQVSFLLPLGDTTPLRLSSICPCKS